MSRKPIRHVLLGFVAAAALLLVGASDTLAAVQTFPGSSCQASGSPQDLYYSGVSVTNRGDSTRSAVCPLVRSNPLAGWSQIRVVVRDRHSTQNITCVAQARDPGGNAGSGWSQTRSSAGEGNQILVFGPPGVAVPNGGPYVVVCSIPAMEEVNQPSYISSIILIEP
jgi:hypothetical protein